MGWLVKHIQEHPGGRKSYRRQYPPHLRNHLSGTQLRVSLGTPRHNDDPEFLKRVAAVAKQWEHNVAIAERKYAGSFDPLTPELIAYLAASWKGADLALDEEVRWTARSPERKSKAIENLSAGISEDLAEALRLRALGDIETIRELWGAAAEDHATALDFVVDRNSVEFPAYLRAFHDSQIEAWRLILQRGEGEDIPTPPVLEAPAKARERRSAPKVPLLDVFDKYATAQGVSLIIREEWRRNLQTIVGFIGHDDANKLTRADVERWRDALLAEITNRGTPRNPSTVKGNYLAPLRLALTWAVEEKRLPVNVAADVMVRVPRAKRLRDKDFTMEEAAMILAASMKEPPARLSAHYKLARRWIPWLCAYSGARVNEFSQFRKEDLKEIDGVWIMNITPEAGTVKTGQARQVPVHLHLIEQGFLEMVQSQPDGPLFYDPSARRVGELQANRLFKKVGEKIAKWVRDDVGITDKSIKPNHAWRHLFKTLCADAGIDEKVADAIQGHAAKTVAQTYGKVSVKARAAAIERFPRFDIG